MHCTLYISHTCDNEDPIALTKVMTDLIGKRRLKKLNVASVPINVTDLLTFLIDDSRLEWLSVEGCQVYDENW